MEIPDRMTVAAPVSELSPMSLTGRRLVSVKYPVSSWMVLASAMPIRMAPNAIHCGSLPWRRMLTSVTPLSLLKLSGR